ncbi:MAG: hypothetical protein V1761_04560 [bacterium]
MIRQAFLSEEKVAIAAFLALSGLDQPHDPTETLYIEENGQVIATVSRTGELVSHLAVDMDHRGENLAEAITSELIARMNAEGLHRHLVYTKPEYAAIFIALHFQMVAAADKVAILESGYPLLTDELALIRAAIERTTGMPITETDLGAIVVNCNPMTLGHLRLIEYAASRHRHLLVFVLEEDRSVFSYQERAAMVWLGCRALGNVIVLPSTKYIVSDLTFPSYFLKTMDERDEAHARLDARIFRDRFMPSLHIAKRYIGTEFDPMMIRYNAILKETLKTGIEEIIRYEADGDPISASRVRKLLATGDTEAALALVPPANRSMLAAIAKSKYGKS